MHKTSVKYMVGVGGIGMSALARYFLMEQYEVWGYDKTPSPLTRQLESEGVKITYDDAVSEPIQNLGLQTTEVIYTPAIPENNKILNHFLNHHYQCLKRAEILGRITEKTKALAVAGTHGKTTTSALLAGIFYDAEVPVNAFLGGILSALDTNAITNKEAQYTIVEADEYDRSFHHLFPQTAVITSVEWDHKDIYPTENSLKEAFQQFADQIDQTGFLIVEEHAAEYFKHPGTITYGYGSRADYQIFNQNIIDGRYHFNIQTPEMDKFPIELALPGVHNVLNATAAFILALSKGVAIDQIQKSLSAFQGIKRRFDIHVDDDKHVYIDDYAHHPDEIKNLIASVRSMYPHRKCTLAFQPHLYSRTNDFFNGFTQELSQVDELILIPIYPAREQAIPGVSSQHLLDKINIENKKLIPREELVAYLEKIQDQTDILITAGAGDIDRFVEPLKELYE